MSKKQKALENQEEYVVQEQANTTVASTPVEGKVDKKAKKSEKVDAKSKDKNKKKDKKKKENKETLGQKTRGTMSELKKVTWPSFGEVVKKTGIVIAFVVLFGLFFYGVNALLGWLVTLLV